MRTEICRVFLCLSRYRERSNGGGHGLAMQPKRQKEQCWEEAVWLERSASSPGEGPWGFLVQISMVAVKVAEGGEGECSQ